MAKKKRKHKSTFDTSSSLNRRDVKKSESIASLCHVSGLHFVEPHSSTQQHHQRHNQQQQQQDGSLDDCLALLDQQYMLGNGHDLGSAQSSPKTRSATSGSSKTKSENSAKELGGEIAGGEKEFLLLSNKIGIYPNKNMHRRSLPTQTMTNGELILPNIQVELARHKLMGELSSYFLSECPSLRMPSFERWVMDSKVEERLKREKFEEENRNRYQQQLGENNKSINNGTSSWKSRMKRKNLLGLDNGGTAQLLHVTSTGKNPINRYDPVIPSMPDDVNDGASQRLLNEMVGKDTKNKEVDVEDGRKAIVKELCRRAFEASRRVQKLSSRLGGPVEAKKYFMKSSVGGGHSEMLKKNTKVKSQHSLGQIVLEINESSQEDLKKGEGKETSSIKKAQAVYTLSYSRKMKKSHSADNSSREMKPFHVKINAPHYEKLRDMFHSIHNSSGEQLYTSGLSSPSLYVPHVSEKSKPSNNHAPAINIFHHLVFCLLVRYASLSGGQILLDLRGGGMQGAIHSQVFDFFSNYSLKSPSTTHCNIMECFASPLNAYSTHFCSVFHEDLDCHFGSYGDFFSAPIGIFGKIGQVHEANPPFSPGLMELMVKRMEDHLRFADSLADDSSDDDHQDQGKLTFIIIVPSCDDKQLNTNSNLITTMAQKSFKCMLQSPFFAKHIVLKAREHGYVEASQHMRPTRYKESQYDTSVFFLQSRTTRNDEKNNPKITSNEAERDLRDVFISRHLKELNERRSRETSITEHKVAEENISDDVLITGTAKQPKLKKRKNKRRKV